MLQEVLKNNWITPDEYKIFTDARKLRNPAINFRRPFGADKFERQAIDKENEPDDIAKTDAEFVLFGVAQIFCAPVFGEHLRACSIL